MACAIKTGAGVAIVLATSLAAALGFETAWPGREMPRLVGEQPSRLAQAGGGGPDGIGRRPRPTAPGEDCATFRQTQRDERYCASSVLAPQGSNSYGVRNMFGSSIAEAWVEGRQGPGIGEWVVVEFSAPHRVKAVTIRNGYQKNPDTFRKNGRVKTLRIVFSTGESRAVSLDDTMDAQNRVVDPPVVASWVQFVIEDVFPGTAFADTAITKLILTAEPAP